MKKWLAVQKHRKIFPTIHSFQGMKIPSKVKQDLKEDFSTYLEKKTSSVKPEGKKEPSMQLRVKLRPMRTITVKWQKEKKVTEVFERVEMFHLQMITNIFNVFFQI